MKKDLGSIVRVLAHVVVWTYLNGPIPKNLEINHKDLDKANNRPGNLDENGRTLPWNKATEWRPGVARLTNEQKAKVIRLRSAGHSCRRIILEMGISKTHIYRILKGAERCQ
jgi:hypothetical protein